VQLPNDDARILRKSYNTVAIAKILQAALKIGWNQSRRCEFVRVNFRGD
jgi:hypothetical protein